jgi:hypothetical protein
MSWYRSVFIVIAVLLVALMLTSVFSSTVLESLYGSSAPKKNITITFLNAKVIYTQDPSHLSKLSFSFTVKPSTDTPRTIFYPKVSNDAPNIISVRSGSIINFPVDTILHTKSNKDLDIRVITDDYSFVSHTGSDDEHLTMQLDRKYNNANSFGVGTHIETATFTREGSETLLIAYRINVD